MGFDVRLTMRSYIQAFEGGFVSFLYLQADILDTIGSEWKAAGKFKWSEAFSHAAINLRAVAEDLSVIVKEHDIQVADEK